MRGLCQRFAQLLSRSSFSVTSAREAFNGSRLHYGKLAIRPMSSLATRANLANTSFKNVGFANTLSFSRSIHSVQIARSSPAILSNVLSRCDTCTQPARSMMSLKKMYLIGRPYKQKRKKKNVLGGNPQMKGVVLRTLVKKPKKPNSANRKCVLLRLTNGLEKVAYIPGEGHNLQEHNVVLVRNGRLRDVPGVKIKCIRGAYDLPHVQKSTKL